MFAESLVQEEEDTYRWWVNSQQDPKKFKWLYAAKSYLSSAANSLLDLVKGLIADPNKPNPIRGSAYEYAKATGNPIVFMRIRGDKITYFNEDMTPKPPEYDARRDRKSVVVRIDG